MSNEDLPVTNTSSLDPTTSRTLPDFIRALGQAYGDKPAVLRGDEVLTFRELETTSARIAATLLLRGIGKGTRVGIIYANSPRWLVLWAAVTRIGAVAVSLSTFLKPPELARVIRHADLHAVISQESFLAQDYVRNLEEALPDLTRSGPDLQIIGAPFLRWIVIDTDPAPAWARTRDWLDTGAGASSAMLAAAEAEVFPEEPAIMIYTSGQSADPKGVLHSHANVTGKIHYLRAMLGHRADSLNMAVLPFFWVGGLVMTFLTTLEIGGTVRCPEGASRPEVGGIMDRMPFPGLGMTETFGMYGWGVEAAHPERPICTPMTFFDPEVQTKIVDDAGRPVGNHEIGQMLVRGRGVTLGIHKVPRASVFDPDGFYRTGDRCEVEDGVVYFVGRVGDMIKTSGANVAPAEVERELVAVEGVAAAHVVGIDDPGRGQIVGAALIPAAGVELNPARIQEQLKARLSSYKVPRLLVVFKPDEVPFTPTYKVNKAVLAQMIRDRAG
jgi:acyl-CoA synthetase (AMP-forming)/AMP-acid ligase II